MLAVPDYIYEFIGMRHNNVRMCTRRLIKAIAVAMIAVAFLSAYLWIVDFWGVMPRCPVKWATGLDCPGCGSQRAFMALINGRPLHAVTHNLILAPAAIYLSILFMAWLCPTKAALQRAVKALTSACALMVIAVLLVAWMVVRNILGI